MRGTTNKQTNKQTVKIRSFLLKEEADPETNSFLRAASIIDNLGEKEKKLLYKTYETLFLVDLTTDMAFSGAGYLLLPPGEPDPSEVMDVEPTPEELKEEERILRQTQLLSFDRHTRRLMGWERRRLRRIQREKTLQRPVEQTGKVKPSNPLLVPHSKKKDIKDIG